MGPWLHTHGPMWQDGINHTDTATTKQFPYILSFVLCAALLIICNTHVFWLTFKLVRTSCPLPWCNPCCVAVSAKTSAECKIRATPYKCFIIIQPLATALLRPVPTIPGIQQAGDVVTVIPSCLSVSYRASTSHVLEPQMICTFFVFVVILTYFLQAPDSCGKFADCRASIANLYCCTRTTVPFKADYCSNKLNVGS